ncbi:hypothetical protein [Fibrivirga algicola]|uniref:Outer membrane lipoprotein carrier protein LolA n=1 Tax=Fibrivirga algicola TaxID=2950420 RepID=A0ABX0QGQ7_9BACT|nr:hypothetical protein [Fibrivirga algicola]ARK11936.1 hypothetical protein A6C57_17255 [Fibrella sp. ES10-3-2-2]NID11247.1 hypothetical protein [Fibrivirga algicola]
MHQPILKGLFGFLLFLSQLTNGLPSVADTPDEALARLLARLQAIKYMRYDYYRDVNYKSEQYRNELSGKVFVGFQPDLPLTGFRFQIESDAFRQVYDGKAYFMLDHTQRTMQVNQQPRQGDLASLSFLVNSPASFRYALATIVADKAIPKSLSDTLVANRPYQLICFSLPSKTISNLGTISSLTTQRLITYKLLVDQSTGLPAQVIQTNNITPDDYVLTRFSNVQVDAVQPEAGTWSYFTYVGDYRLTSKK